MMRTAPLALALLAALAHPADAWPKRGSTYASKPDATRQPWPFKPPKGRAAPSPASPYIWTGNPPDYERHGLVRDLGPARFPNGPMLPEIEVGLHSRSSETRYRAELCAPLPRALQPDCSGRR